jgi:hypothetical protein
VVGYLNWFPAFFSIFAWWTFDYADIKLRTETMQLVTEASQEQVQQMMRIKDSITQISGY